MDSMPGAIITNILSVWLYFNEFPMAFRSEHCLLFHWNINGNSSNFEYIRIDSNEIWKLFRIISKIRFFPVFICDSRVSCTPNHETNLLFKRLIQTVSSMFYDKICFFFVVRAVRDTTQTEKCVF